MASTQVLISKIGPCGGTAGTVRDMNINGITRIVKISIRHGTVIDAMTVRFLRNGSEESTGQWGGMGGKLTEFTLRDSEYITSVKGHFEKFREWIVVTSLKFETNLGSYGPYGTENGVPFELSANGGQIIGFHGRPGEYLDALGVYVKASTQVLINKIGPCGGTAGTVRDMNINGITRIVKISIRHGTVIDAMTVRFLRNGKEESTGQWGGMGGKLTEFTLRDSEYITSVKGHFEKFREWIVVKSLKFETNLGSYGPYGTENGVPFELSANGGQIIGFHGRPGEYLDALGVYVKAPTQVLISKIGPCGGTAGTVRDMNINGITRIVKISIRHGTVIDAITVRFLRNGKEESTGQWGGMGGKLTEFTLRDSEYITSVKGHFEKFREWVVVKSLKFETNLGSYGPYGTENGVPFELSANGGQIIGFHGRPGEYLDALGVYVKVNTTTNSLGCAVNTVGP